MENLYFSVMITPVKGTDSYSLQVSPPVPGLNLPYLTALVYDLADVGDLARDMINDQMELYQQASKRDTALGQEMDTPWADDNISNCF